MLTMLCNYAATQNLPYEFVEWALDKFGHDVTDFPSLRTVHEDWNNQ